jgi:hypothetical protein
VYKGHPKTPHPKFEQGANLSLGSTLAMAIITNSTLFVSDYKEINGISRLDIFKSKTSGKFYATHPDGTFVGMVSKDIDWEKPVSIITVTDDATGESWKFLGNTEKEAVRTL